MQHHLYSIYGIPFKSTISFPELTHSRRRFPNRANQIYFRKHTFRTHVPPHQWHSFQGFKYWLSPRHDFAILRGGIAGTFKVDFIRKQIDWKPEQKAKSSGLARAVAVGRALGLLLPYVQPTLPLHASSPVINGKAVGFLGPRGMGKSTVVASFLDQGHTLLSDDLAVLEKRGNDFWVKRGSSEIRLWPKTMTAYKNRRLKMTPVYPETQKKRVSLENGCSWGATKKDTRLKALYLLHRKRKGPVRIEAVKGQEAMKEVLRNIYNPMIEDPKILGQQFEMVTHLTQRIPVKRLVYPTGLRHLAKVRQAVLGDLRTAP